MKLPDKFVEKMSIILGEDLDKFLSSLDKENVKALTVDTNKITLEEFEKEIEKEDIEITKIPYIPNGYYYTGKIGDTVLHHAGVIYSQDASAMLPVEALEVEEGDKVLDVCASPGGKSIQILEKLNGTGLLVTNEYVYNRAKILYENLVRFGYKNFIILNNLPKDFDKNCLLFDKILVDAPCSGEGMFRKKDIDTYSWNEKNVEMCAVRQLEILNSVKDLLVSGGRLVYSTCTYNLEENEKVVAKFLETNKEFRLVELPKNVLDNTARGKVVNNLPTNMTGKRFPHLHEGEGQFVAVFEKVEGIDYTKKSFAIDRYIKLSKKERESIITKLNKVIDLSQYDLYKKGDNIYIVPEVDLDLTGLNVVDIGTYLGTYEKGEIKLSHDFYKAFGEEMYNKIELTYSKAKVYLTGNEIELDTKVAGIVAVNYLGFPLGGGKVVNGKLKNYYPKNLRKRT